MSQKETPGYTQLRLGLRGLLSELGVDNNPGVTNLWIINQLRQLGNMGTEKVTSVNADTSPTLLRQSIVHLIIELGGEVPNSDQKGSVREARKLVYMLYGLFEPYRNRH